MEEDITKNIFHARKVLNRTHKDRKLAWLLGRIKYGIKQYLSQSLALSSKIVFIVETWKLMQKAAGLQEQFSIYKIYILEHAN